MMRSRLQTLLVWALLCGLGACLALTVVDAGGRHVVIHSKIKQVRDLYANVNRTLPSEVNARENEEIIRARLRCYGENDDYATRIGVCGNAYVKDILNLARKTIRSQPDLGDFVKNIELCPAMYSMCMGQTGNDLERCVLFERQCIDYTLDTYWRGAPPYPPQQYRSER